MQELINKLVAEAGLTADQAGKALQVIVGHVKGILPPAFGDSIDNMLSGKVDTSSFAANTGKAKTESILDKAENLADQAGDKIENLADKAKEKLSQYVDTNKLGAMADKAEDKLDEIADKAEDIAKDAFGKLKGFFGGSDKKD
jgi:ElaB/YqjD/DUF883 family membrane-anchored ribosome-binding protein